MLLGVQVQDDKYFLRLISQERDQDRGGGGWGTYLSIVDGDPGWMGSVLYNQLAEFRH